MKGRKASYPSGWAFIKWNAEFFRTSVSYRIQKSERVQGRLAKKFPFIVFLYALLRVKLDVARLIEYPKAVEYLHPTRKDVILDIGSGSSCFPTFLSRFYRSEVIAIDVDLHSLKRQCTAVKNLSSRYIRENLHLIQADARYLPLKEKVFRKIVSISTIEHIPSDDDLVSAEIRRVLQGGGVCVLSFPYAVQPKNPQPAPDFMRWYTDSDIETRIVKPSKLSVCRKYLFEKRYMQVFLGHGSRLRQFSLGYVFIHYVLGLFFNILDDRFLKEDKNANGCILKLGCVQNVTFS